MATLGEDEVDPSLLVPLLPLLPLVLGWASFAVHLIEPRRTLVGYLLSKSSQLNLLEEVSMFVAPLTKLSLFKVTLTSLVMTQRVQGRIHTNRSYH